MLESELQLSEPVRCKSACCRTSRFFGGVSTNEDTLAHGCRGDIGVKIVNRAGKLCLVTSVHEGRGDKLTFLCERELVDA